MKTPLLPTLLLSTTLLAKEVSLLGGHLVIDLPDDAKPGIRSTGIMGPEPGTDETLYWIGAGDKRIAVFSREMLEFAGPNFIGKAKHWITESCPADFEIRTIGDDIVYGLATDAAKGPTEEACYGVAYVRSKDGMVQNISFHFAREAYKDIQAAREFITKALTSVKDGGWSPDLSARNVTFGKEWGMDISIPLPEGYFFVHDPGYDFDVYRFKEVRKPGSQGSGIGVYIGCHPNRSEMDDCENLKDGKMLGKDIKWCIFTEEADDECIRAEALVEPRAGVYMHVFLYADSQEKLGVLISAAEGIAIEGAKTQREAAGIKKAVDEWLPHPLLPVIQALHSRN